MSSGPLSDEVEVDDVVGYQKLVNPAIVGPGQWYMLHSLAAYCDADQNTRWDFFENFVRTDFLKKIRCEKCNGHANAFLASTPIGTRLRPNPTYGNFRDKRGRPLGLFKWTFDFHNTVNKRLNKRIMSLDDAISIFVDNDFLAKQYELAIAEGRQVSACTADCEGESETSASASAAAAGSSTVGQQQQTVQTARATPVAAPQRVQQRTLAGAFSNLAAWASSPSVNPSVFPPPLLSQVPVGAGRQPASSSSSTASSLSSPSTSSPNTFGYTVPGAGFIVKRSR